MFSLKTKPVKTTYFMRIFFFCIVCYDAIFPINKIVDMKLILSNYYLAFKSVLSNTYAKPHSAYTLYTSTGSLNAKENFSDLSIYN